MENTMNEGQTQVYADGAIDAQTWCKYWSPLP